MVAVPRIIMMIVEFHSSPISSRWILYLYDSK
jgi:hypothetical protein